ncbi:MAG: glycosyltransferase family 2 protein [Halioglobus sp.]
MPVIAVIILNWNDAEAAICCAGSVLCASQNATPLQVEVKLYLVDNGSHDKDADTLRNWCDSQHTNQVAPLVANQSNLGFGAGMNAGIASAKESNPEYFLILNNDLELSAEAISHLLAFSAAHSRIVATGLTILESSTGRVQAAGGYRYYPWLGYSRPLLGGATLEQVKTATIQMPSYLAGAAMWLTGDFVRRIGGLPTDHFLYFEELEIMQRLLPGEHIGVCVDATVTHRGGGSATTPELQERAAYFAALSAFNYTWRYHKVCLASVVAARIIGVGARSLAKRQPKLLLAVITALVDFACSKITQRPDNREV